MTEPRPDKIWQTCEAGELKAFASRDKHRKLLERFVRLGSASVLGSVVLLSAYAYWPQFSQNLSPDQVNPSTIANRFDCIETIEVVDRFLQHTVDAEDEQRVREHLKKCPACQRHYRQRAEELGLVRNQTGSESDKNHLHVDFRLGKYDHLLVWAQ